MQDELRRWATVGSGVAELVLNRAEQLVKELVREGEIQREAAAGVVRDIMERTKDDRDEVARALRVEIQNQTAQLGLASAREVERLEGAVDRLTERIGRLEARLAEAGAEGSSSSARKKTTGEKKPGRKNTGKKTTGKTTPKKTAAKKPTRGKGSSRKKGSSRRSPPRTSGRKPGSGRSRAS